MPCADFIAKSREAETNSNRRLTLSSDVTIPLNGLTLKAETGHYILTGRAVPLRVLRDLALEPAGPFYRFVLTYLVASAGLTPVYDATHYPTFMRDVGGRFPGTVKGDLQANLAECVASARDGETLPQLEAEKALCCMLANAAYESVNEAHRVALKGDPVFEFFRHVRHAASHGNTWHFFAKEPSAHAEWHGIAIDETRKGDENHLQGKPCFYGTIQPADLLHLLQDVEDLLKALEP